MRELHSHFFRSDVFGISRLFCRSRGETKKVSPVRNLRGFMSKTNFRQNADKCSKVVEGGYLHAPRGENVFFAFKTVFFFKFKFSYY